MAKAVVLIVSALFLVGSNVTKNVGSASQLTFPFSKLVETLQKGVKYVQS